jgi:hypothetical protein
VTNKMVDVFGSLSRRQGKQGRLGPVGPTGPAGKDALQLDIWCPKFIAQQFRASATCCFYFDSEIDGILYDPKKKPIGLKNRVNDEKNNAICVRALKTPVQTGKSFSIPLSSDTCFEILKIQSALLPKTVFIVAFSFRLIEPITDELPYYIFSNTNSTRAVSLKKDWLDIAGCAKGSPQLTYQKKSWNYMIIQYSRVTSEGSADRCFFILNGRRGSFQPIVFENDAQELYIGHKIKKSANIELNYFQVHTKHLPQSISDDYVLPETFSDLLRDDMQRRVSKFEE